MADPTIHGPRRVFSASAVLDAIAADLSQIKTEDGLTDEDLGRVLGKSDDQAAKYRTGLAEMGLVAFAAGMREWNGRFTGSLFRLCEETRPGIVCDHSGQTSILAAALALSKALEDGEITPREVRECRSVLEDAKAAIDAQLAKLTMRNAS
jgi:hypothetical protein